MNRIRRMRIAAGLSQLDLARQAGISQQQLSKLERGVNDLSLKRAQGLADVIGCSALDVMAELAGGPVTSNAMELEILQTCRQLSGRDRDVVLALAKSMLRSEPAAASA